MTKIELTDVRTNRSEVIAPSDIRFMVRLPSRGVTTVHRDKECTLVIDTTKLEAALAAYRTQK